MHNSAVKCSANQCSEVGSNAVYLAGQSGGSPVLPAPSSPDPAAAPTPAALGQTGQSGGQGWWSQDMGGQVWASKALDSLVESRPMVVLGGQVWWSENM